jgi:hypothetical protein
MIDIKRILTINWLAIHQKSISICQPTGCLPRFWQQSAQSMQSNTYYILDGIFFLIGAILATFSLRNSSMDHP